MDYKPNYKVTLDLEHRIAEARSGKSMEILQVDHVCGMLWARREWQDLKEYKDGIIIGWWNEFLEQDRVPSHSMLEEYVNDIDELEWRWLEYIRFRGLECIKSDLGDGTSRLVMADQAGPGSYIGGDDTSMVTSSSTTSSWGMSLCGIPGWREFDANCLITDEDMMVVTPQLSDNNDSSIFSKLHRISKQQSIVINGQKEDGSKQGNWWFNEWYAGNVSANNQYEREAIDINEESELTQELKQRIVCVKQQLEDKIVAAQQICFKESQESPRKEFMDGLGNILLFEKQVEHYVMNKDKIDSTTEQYGDQYTDLYSQGEDSYNTSSSIDDSVQGRLQIPGTAGEAIESLNSAYKPLAKINIEMCMIVGT